MSYLSRALRFDSRTVSNVEIICSSSASDQTENEFLASSIEQVHNFTVTLPHRIQGMTKPP